MNKQVKRASALQIKNRAIIRAYNNIIRDMVALLPLYHTKQLRIYITSPDVKECFTISKEFYSPILFISLSEYEGVCTIAFAKNFEAKSYVGTHRDTEPFRIIYKHTSYEHTKVNIEDALEEYCYYYKDYKEALEECKSGNKNYKLITRREA
jgi:hypothetical protein